MLIDIMSKQRLHNPYLYTFSLYENTSFIIVSAETDYISTRSWYRNINFLRDRIRRIVLYLVLWPVSQMLMTFQEIRIIATGPSIANQLRDVSTICRKSWYIAAHVCTVVHACLLVSILYIWLPNSKVL